MVRRARYLILLAAMACGGPGRPGRPPPDRCSEVAGELARGQELAEQGYLGRALPVLRAADDRCSTETSAAALADALRELGIDAAGRAKLAAETTEDDRRRARLLYRDGGDRRIAGSHDQAIAQLERSFALWPQPLTLVQIGLAHRAAGRARQARAAFARALAVAEAIAGAPAVPRIRTGHGGIIGMARAVAFGPRGRLVATGGTDGQIIVWDASSGRPVQSIRGHDLWVNDLSFSPDGEHLASAAGSGEVWVSRVATGEVVRTMSVGSRNAWTVAYSGDGAVLVATADDGVAHWLDPASGTVLASVKVGQRPLLAGAIAPDGGRIAVGDDQGRLALVDREGPIARVDAHRGQIWALAFESTGSQLVSAGNDGAVRLWSGDDLAPAGDVATLSGAVSAVAFAPDGREVVVSRGGGRTTWWPTDGAAEPSRSLAQGFSAIALSPDGVRVAGAGIDGAAVWDVLSGGRIHELRSPWRPVRGLLAAPDGSLITAGAGGVLIRWPVGTGVRPEVLFDGDAASQLALDSTGRWLASGDDGPVLLLDLTASPPRRPITLATVPVRALAFDRSGRLVVGGDERLQIWRVDRREKVADQVMTARVSALAADPHEDRLAVGDGSNLVMMTTEPLAEDQRLPAHISAIDDIAYGPDGSWLVTASDDHTARTFGSRFQFLRGHTASVRSVAASAELVATGSEDATVRLWNGAGEPVRTLTDHVGWVEGLAFTGGGSTLVSAATDGTVRLWDPGTGAPKAVLASRMDTAGEWVALARDGRVDGSQRAHESLYWQVGDQQLPGFVGWQRNRTEGLLRELRH